MNKNNHPNGNGYVTKKEFKEEFKALRSEIKEMFDVFAYKYIIPIYKKLEILPILQRDIVNIKEDIVEMKIDISDIKKDMREALCARCCEV